MQRAVQRFPLGLAFSATLGHSTAFAFAILVALGVLVSTFTSLAFGHLALEIVSEPLLVAALILIVFASQGTGDGTAVRHSLLGARAGILLLATYHQLSVLVRVRHMHRAPLPSYAF